MLFRLVPAYQVYSVPFHSVPVLSNSKSHNGPIMALGNALLLPQQIIIHLATDIPVKLFYDKRQKTHAIPLGNHVTQQKLTEITENRSALTKTLNFGIFRFIPLYSGLFGCHSGSFRHIPVPFWFILFHSGIFRSVPVFSNAPHCVRVVVQ